MQAGPRLVGGRGDRRWLSLFWNLLQDLQQHMVRLHAFRLRLEIQDDPVRRAGR